MLQCAAAPNPLARSAAGQHASEPHVESRNEKAPRFPFRLRTHATPIMLAKHNDTRSKQRAVRMTSRGSPRRHRRTAPSSPLSWPTASERASGALWMAWVLLGTMPKISRSGNWLIFASSVGHQRRLKRSPVPIIILIVSPGAASALAGNHGPRSGRDRTTV